MVLSIKLQCQSNLKKRSKQHLFLLFQIKSFAKLIKLWFKKQLPFSKSIRYFILHIMLVISQTVFFPSDFSIKGVSQTC